jgi:hypothetical protein
MNFWAEQRPGVVLGGNLDGVDLGGAERSMSAGKDYVSIAT